LIAGRTSLGLVVVRGVAAGETEAGEAGVQGTGGADADVSIQPENATPRRNVNPLRSKDVAPVSSLPVEPSKVMLGSIENDEVANARTPATPPKTKSLAEVLLPAPGDDVPRSPRVAPK
jgi:hypothetical protein